MLIEADIFDICCILKDCGLSDNDVDIISDYIYDCVTYEIDIRQWISNIDYRCFETEEELEEFLENESLDKNDVYTYKASNGIFCEIG